MRFSEAELLALAASFVWPFLRIGAMFVSFPMFSSQSVPVRVRIVVSVATTFLVVPLLPTLPSIDLFSHQGFIVAIQQVLIGVLTGFIVQLVFAMVVFAGQSIAFSMGLGFASMIDPQTGVQVPIVAQLYVMLSTLVFLGLDGHLLVIHLLIDSFQTLPISLGGVSTHSLWKLIQWGGQIFTGGFLLALPVLSALLFVNLAFGVATRAAPQLNVFSVGFSVTIFLGLILLWITLPNVLTQFTLSLNSAYQLISEILVHYK